MKEIPMRGVFLAGLLAVSAAADLSADVGDPQTRTDHPWYPGELSCSTFDRLFATQAALFQRVTGAEPRTDEDKALASWYWRNLNYFHAEEGTEDPLGKGWVAGEPPATNWTRDYWTGLFSNGFGLCYTTHVQWSVEMEALLGHCRSRGTGVAAHYSFEVFLTGGAYGDGKWVLLDHDISTIVRDPQGGALMGTLDLAKDYKTLTDRTYKPERQKNWPMCAYVPEHGAAYRELNSVAYLAGYGGPTPMVHLRRGETLRRYPRPGLEDGKTFVFWGRNYGVGGVPGPERSAAWVNQPEKFYGGLNGTGWKEGRARYANAVFTYAPDFASGDYREGVVQEDERQVVFEFVSPYIIGCTPAGDGAWAIYEPGGRNGLVLQGTVACPVSVSVDDGKTWKDAGTLKNGLDLTDLVKGRRQYRLRLGAGAKALAGSGFRSTTVCQCSSSVVPRLKDDGTKVRFEATNRALVAGGPNLDQARARLVEGAFPSPSLTFEIAAPRQEKVARIYAAAMIDSWNPPRPNVHHTIESSTDGGTTWTPVVKDWMIQRREPEPKVIAPLTHVWGSADVSGTSPVRVRIRNDRGMEYPRAEVHLAYETRGRDATKVTFDWTDRTGAHRESHAFAAGSTEEWALPTGKDAETRWVEYEPAPRR
ncbi:MAG: hypothetical protein JO332_00025 [Planctomycetaceae bacterium]|nr:hypothetical protein [Planctomycetaceae bacterium]